MTSWKSLAVHASTVLMRNLGAAVPPALFAVPYIALLFWFHDVDVYHRHFSQSGWIVGFYNAFRLLFIFYLFCIVEAAGNLLLRIVAGKELAETTLFEGIALCFFTGAGAWHAGLLGFGFLNLYTFPAAIVLTLPFVILSYGHVCNAAFAICSAVGTWKAGITQRATDSSELLILGLLVIAFAMLLLVKGLYPGGNLDYFTHYFYYFESVVAHHGIWPNEVYQNYFYDKGAGLTFLAMILTDPLAPQLVTFCFMAAATLVVFLASRAAAPDTDWPYLAALLFVVIYIYTPNWAEFEKTHELTTALVIAAIWAAGGAFAHCGNRTNRLWPITASAALAAAVITTQTVAVVLGGMFGILFIWYLVVGNRSRARVALLFAAIVGVLFLGTFAVNYATTGLLNDLALLPTWRFSNVEKLYQLDTLPMALEAAWRGTWPDYHAHWSQALKVLDQASRFDLVYPFIIGAIAVAIVAFLIRRRDGRWAGPRYASHQAGILLAAVPAFVVVALWGGVQHFDSFYRFASFMVPLVLVGSVSLWALPISGANPKFLRIAQDRRLPLFIFALCLVTIAAATHPTRLFIILSRAARFSVGTISIDTAYTLQPFAYPRAENAIFPGARGAYAVVGPGVSIWSLHHNGTYCMLPGCQMESFREFVLPGWAKLMFGSPEQGRDALQASAHNYFLFVRDLEIMDCLPLSPLFSPENIAQYLGIRWTDGTTTLLTWLAPGIQPLDAGWVDDYRRTMARSTTVRIFPYEGMKQIFTRLEQTPHPWHSFALPWTKGNVD